MKITATITAATSPCQPQKAGACSSGWTTLTLSALMLGIALSVSSQNVPPTAPREYPLMRFTAEEKQQFLEERRRLPRMSADARFTPTFPTSANLLALLPYVPAERDQGDCGNCWQWAGNGVLEIALNAQHGLRKRLSVQFINTCNSGKRVCQSGWLNDVSEFYCRAGYVVPWANKNAQYLNYYAPAATPPCSLIAKTPRYGIRYMSTVTIPTHGVGQAQAVANIKSVLCENKAVWFAFFLPTTSDWQRFHEFWHSQPETSVWRTFGCGQLPDEGERGHAVLCVGYRDEGPGNRYWLMVNSWGTAGGMRPHGTFRVAMDLNYDCADATGWDSLHWQTLDVQFRPEDLVGSLEVTVHPPGAVAQHAQWRVDEGDWRDSGTTVSDLIEGMHTVTFKPIPGYRTPPSRQLQISGSGRASVTGVYVADVTAARYNGLFHETLGLAPSSSGYLAVDTTRARTFSGVLCTDSGRYPLSGRFDAAGAARLKIARANRTPLEVGLQWDVASGGNQITGKVSDGSFTADLLLDRCPFDGTSNEALWSGRYTMVIPGVRASTLAPPGDGLGVVTVDKAGRVTLTGLLADGTAISQSARLSRSGQWPLYVPLYRGGGAIAGWITFTNVAKADFGGNLVWIKPALATASRYTNGFELQSGAWGSRYKQPRGNNPGLDFAHGSVVLTAGGWDESITNEIILGPNTAVASSADKNLKVLFRPASGYFTGVFQDTAQIQRISFRGVVLQNQNIGSGFFLTTNQSGHVLLGPQP